MIYTYIYIILFQEVVDPQLVMLKLNLDDQLDNVQYMTAMKF